MFKLLGELKRKHRILVEITNYRNFFVSTFVCASENDDKTKVLNTINNLTLNEMVDLGISKSRSEQLINWRNQNGNFKTFNQILEINGFGTKIVEKLVNIISNPSDKKIKNKEAYDINKKSNRTGMQFSIPIVSEPIISNLKSCVSLQIGVSNISWTQFVINPEEQCVLKNWKYHKIIEKKLHINDLVKISTLLINEIPESNCYVLENPVIAQVGQPGSPAQVNINTQKSQLIAILSYALSNRKFDGTELSKSTSNLFFLKKHIYPRLFDTLVGTESVSTMQTVSKLIKNDSIIPYSLNETNSVNTNEINNRGKITFPQNFENEFQNLDGVQREFIGQTILIGLTFIRLCILKCPESILKLKPKSKQ